MNRVNPSVNDRDNQDMEELLAAAAFGTLTPEEAAALEGYLATHPAARAELAELQALAGDLTMLADEVEPPATLRGQIEQAILATPQEPAAPTDRFQPLNMTTAPAAPATAPIPFPGWRRYAWAAAAAVLIALVAGVLIDRFLLQDTDEGDAQVIAYKIDLATPAPNLSAELTYDPDQRLFVLETENMPAAPQGQVYQIWLIDQNNVPQPKGVMTEPTFAVAADRGQYAAFAITVEPGPLGSEEPTSQPFFVAPLTPEADDQD